MKIHELIENVEYKCGDSKYRIAIDGFFEFKTPGGQWTESYSQYNTVTGMEFTECEFEPEFGEEYFYPTFYENQAINRCQWADSNKDNNIKRVVGVYRTKDQAIEKAKELGWVE